MKDLVGENIAGRINMYDCTSIFDERVYDKMGLFHGYLHRNGAKGFNTSTARLVNGRDKVNQCGVWYS